MINNTLVHMTQLAQYSLQANNCLFFSLVVLLTLSCQTHLWSLRLLALTLINCCNCLTVFSLCATGLSASFLLLKQFLGVGSNLLLILTKRDGSRLSAMEGGDGAEVVMSRIGKLSATMEPCFHVNSAKPLTGDLLRAKPLQIGLEPFPTDKPREYPWCNVLMQSRRVESWLTFLLKLHEFPPPNQDNQLIKTIAVFTSLI